MINITGYAVDTIFLKAEKYVIYKAIRIKDKIPVLLKIMVRAPKNPVESKILKHEYEILNRLPMKQVIKAESLETTDDADILVLQDSSSDLLTYFIPENGMELLLFLKLAIKLADIFIGLHRFPLVHLEVRPSNILYHPEKEELTLMGFSSASILNAGKWEVTSADWSKETLVYMSPEQTGRMNRSIDWRSDLYSLGVTFYQMLTGQLPFQAEDEMEWAHSHIARTPLAPHRYSSSIPEAVSDIIMMCLSKTIEDRYQSAYGLKRDMEECRTRLQQSGKIEYFFPGFYDISDRFQIPQKLYGREKEIESLNNAFSRVLETGGREIVYITGYAGIGKTFLISELQKLIVEQRGYFVRGKFDQFQRYVPYECLIQAFRELANQMLTESDRQVTMWKETLQSGLGVNGQLIIDVIPEMELILGKQPPLQVLTPEETSNRFHSVFQQFVRAIAKADHPLVLCLDDLQWADTASLELVELLATDPDIQYLMIVGAFRDNEVVEPHPLIKITSAMTSVGLEINEYELEPFAEELVNQYCADTLHCSLETTEPLAHLIYAKTHGNPFFMSQFLNALNQDQLLSFNAEIGQWVWDLERIQKREITDNVVEFMSDKIRRLTPQTQDILKLAACIGNQFDFKMLTLASKKNATESAAALWELVEEGLVITDLKFQISHLSKRIEAEILSSGLDQSLKFKFLHDRVQQAAYSQIEESQRNEAHLKIGRLMLENTKSEDREAHIFDITNQMNIGRDLVETEDERILLTELNLNAGIKAKRSNACELSLQYFTVGLEILGKLVPDKQPLNDFPASLWDNHYGLLSSLFKERAEAEYLNGNIDSAERYFETLLKHVRTPLEKAGVYSFKTMLLTNLGKNHEATQMGIKGLNLLNIRIPTKPGRLKILFELVKVIWRLRRRTVEELADLPSLEDERKTIIMNLIMVLYAPTYIINQNLLTLLILKSMTFTLKFGNARDTSPLAYSAFGFLMGSAFKRYRSGYRFGKLGIAISETYNHTKLIGFNYFVFGCFINNTLQPAKQANEYLLKAYQRLMESGAHLYAGYASVALLFNLSLMGTPLEDLYDEAEQHLQFAIKVKDQESIKFIVTAQRFVLALQGKTTFSGEFAIKSSGEEELLKKLTTSHQSIALTWFYVKKLQVLFLLGQFQQALSFAEKVSAMIENSTGLSFISEYMFYYFLTLTSISQKEKSNPNASQQRLLKRFLRTMEQWSRFAPENFQHLSLLMKAELFHLQGQESKATSLYLEAIESAREQEFIQIVGIAYERLAELCLQKGTDAPATIFIKEAHAAFLKWGATSKADQLLRKYGRLISSEPDFTQLKFNMTEGFETSTDLTTIIKASQTVGSEIELNKLLKNLMQIVIENAGANKGFLILHEDDRWQIQAEGTFSKNKTISVQPYFLELSNIAKAPLPLSVFHYVERTQQMIVMKDATKERPYLKDPYVVKFKPKSLFCSPITHQGKMVGILYLENNLVDGVFTPKRLEVIGLISAQAAISIVNARLYKEQKSINAKLQREVNERKEMEKELLTINEELERSNKELKEMQSQLVQSAKLASIGELATGMAHELNQPLMFIRNSAQLLLMDNNNSASEKQVQETLLDIEKSTGNMTNIINHLREFARLNETDLTPLDLHDVIEDSLILINEQLRIRDIRLEKLYAEDLPMVMGNAQQLEQVFINILTNARDAMEQVADARLIIKTGYLQLTEHHGEVSIIFDDNGHGISEENKEKIFDPFFSTKEAGQGTGLGLSISYGIIRDHQGRIIVESDSQRGSIFRVILPVSVKEEGNL